MRQRKITMQNIIEKFHFVVLAGKEGIEREVTTSSLSRAGLVLAGYTNYYPANRIQILGKTELSFLAQLPQNIRIERFTGMCHENTPGIILESMFAPFTAMHGVLVDIYGMGVLITGKSGVGKSETALELVKRGHRLVADDSVEIYHEDEET